MSFQPVDYETWPRRPYFEHYFHNLPCTYSLTTELDITALLPLAIQAHHAVADGFHVGRLLERLRAWAGETAEL